MRQINKTIACSSNEYISEAFNKMQMRFRDRMQCNKVKLRIAT